MTDEFDALLNLDPLLEAEKVTGKSYKEDGATSALGFLFLQAKARQVRDELALRDDTHRGCAYADAYRIIEEEGFTHLHRATKDVGYAIGGHEYRDVFWRDGVLAVLESYASVYRSDPPERGFSSITLYTNWIPTEHAGYSKFTSSGQWTRHTPGFEGELPEDPWVWTGYWQIIDDGFRNVYGKLRDNGTFVKPWVKNPIHHLAETITEEKRIDKEGMDAFDARMKRYAQETRDFISTLPPEVSECILPAEEW